MKKFAFIDVPNGNIRYTAIPSDETAYTSGNYYNGLLCQELDYSINDITAMETLYWKDGWKTRIKNPNPVYTWDNVSETWQDPRTLQDFKDAKWEEIKNARLQAEAAGFNWDGSVFDSDIISQQRITSAVVLAQLNPSYSVDWTLKDNTTRTLNQADMFAVGQALGQHIQTQFIKGQTLRTQLDAATTKEQVEAITWE